MTFTYRVTLDLQQLFWHVTQIDQPQSKCTGAVWVTSDKRDTLNYTEVSTEIEADESRRYDIEAIGIKRIIKFLINRPMRWMDEE